ncbi:hypothetical protein C8J56DRAFT_172549 [Mycena floridula]|nr:hypothetical protein C8J56DRAFT_172549 [Mycena floridula]
MLKVHKANVLVQDNLRCCLADFGLSSMAASLSLRASSTGDSKGSIRWLAPEFFVSSGDRNHLKSTSRDIYAFACTILEVYTGHHPFLEHKIDPPVIHDVLAGQRPPRPPELNDDLWTLTQACWQQDPDRRPSARKVMRFLQQKDYLDMRSIGTLQILNPESTSNMSPTRDRNPQRLPPAIPTPTINAENSQVVNVARRSRSFWNFARLYGRNNQPAKAVFGVPLQDSLSVAQISNLPAVIFRTIQYLEAGKGKQTEDIYSVKGSYTVINGLKARFNAEGDVNLMSNGYWDPHVVADLLKSFLRELPDSILTHELHPDFSSVLGIVDPEQRVIQLSRLVTTLPSANYNLLRALIAHLSVIVENASTNKMTMRQIGIVLGPTVGISAGLLSLMMVQFDRIFGTSTQEGIPEEAATEATSQVSTPLTRLSAFDGHIDSEPDRESASAGSSGRSETDGESELTRMVGYLTATGSEDWPVVLDLCERASLSDSNAKEVVRALRREFKYGEPSTQLSAASLWAITLSNSTETFISQSTAGTFLETLEDLLTRSVMVSLKIISFWHLTFSSPDTSPVVKERVMVVVCAAASASGDTKDSAFGRLWQKVKPHFKPGEGFPDNNIERLFQQCKIAQGNARVLAQALAGAQTLNDLQNGARAGIIMEFHATCVSSQAIICEQIEVAGLAAELSRSMKHRERLPIHGRIQTISTDSNQPSADEDPDTPFEMTIEEKLLAELLAVNTELLEVLGQYAHLEELGVQRET